ncbi:MAG: undecaprenyl-diphosphate phosphatase [Candidatus Shapirobacteria bacterium]|jgi:undecaprenyl-diphosphatase|nr:undecaprenyl-diphosphate phosphatase [Candidatus Shapirobacteria bacterium]
MSLIQSIFLGLVQAVTEFLPVSSDGHLNLFQHFIKLTPSLTFDIFLHAATFLSVIFFFRHQTKYFFSNIKYIIVGSIPAAIVGILLKDQIESIASLPNLLPYFFLFTGIMVLSTKFITTKDKSLSFFSAFIIGVFQAFAILPAISRSGGTIFSALLLGLSPQNAFNFSFSLFIPASLGAIILSLKDIISSDFLTLNNLISFVFASIIGYFVLNIFQKITINKKFWIFGVYVIFLSAILFFIL